MSDKPVVFLPGTLCDERLWMPVWQKVLINDRRYVPLQWAETLEQMLGLTEYAIENQPVHLVSFSMGGYIASLNALKKPEHVASLTLVGFNPAGLDKQEVQQRQQLIKALHSGKVGPMNQQRLNQFIYANHPHAAKVRQQIQEMEKDLGNTVLKYQLQATSDRKNLVNELSRCSFPVHIVAGDYDQITPSSHLKQAHAQLANSTYHCIQDSGHMMPLEQPQQLASLLEKIFG